MNTLALHQTPHCASLDMWKLCFETTPPSLNTLRRAFTALMMYAFSAPERFDGYEDVIRCVQYSTDPSKSKLNIAASTALDPGSTEMVPGILVQVDPNGMELTSHGMSPETRESSDFASINLVNMASVQLVFKCRHHDADISCSMADIVLLFLFSIRNKLFETWNWLREYQPKNQTEPKLTTAPDDTNSKWYESSVVIKLDYEYSTFVTRESKRFKDYTLEPSPEL